MSDRIEEAAAELRMVMVGALERYKEKTGKYPANVSFHYEYISTMGGPSRPDRVLSTIQIEAEV